MAVNRSGRSFATPRTPSKWDGEERSFVRQILDLFDRIWHGDFIVANDSKLAKQMNEASTDILNDRIQFESFTDFNAFKGIDGKIRYGKSVNGAASNPPLAGNHTYRGYVIGVNTYCTQHFTIESSAAGSSVYNRGRTFTRCLINSTWGQWQETEGLRKYTWLPGCDLDDIVAPGFYGISSLQTYTHGPGTGVAGIMEVSSNLIDGTYVIQRIYNANAFWQRTKFGSSGTTWSSWYKYTGTVVS